MWSSVLCAVSARHPFILQFCEPLVLPVDLALLVETDSLVVDDREAQLVAEHEAASTGIVLVTAFPLAGSREA